VTVLVEPSDVICFDVYIYSENVSVAAVTIPDSGYNYFAIATDTLQIPDTGYLAKVTTRHWQQLDL
jgi:hypothetical protein